MAELSYPATLPNPSRAQHTPKTRTRASDSVGLSLYQNYQSDYTGTMPVEFFLTAEQVPIFYTWWQTDLLEGGRWFNCSWPALRTGALVVQIIDEPVWAHTYNGACKVTATVQIRGASKSVVKTRVLNPDLISLIHFDDADGTVNPRDETSILTFQNMPLDPGPFSFVRPTQGKFGGGFERAQDPNGQIAGGLRSLATSALNGKSWTGDFWVRIDGAPFNINHTKRIFSVGDTVINAQPRFIIEGESTSSPNYVLGTYYHVCVEYWHGAPQLTLFVDGVPVSIKPGTRDFFETPTSIICVGSALGNGDFYTGAVDEWRLVGRALHEGQSFTPPTQPYTIYE